MASVKLGARVPMFSIPASDGEFRMGASKDENLVVYFYPRDNTPGCTLEGGDFRDLAPSFRRARSEEDHAVASLFAVWKQKHMYGRKMTGIGRSTFLIDARGVLRREWRKLRVAGHAAEVLAAAREL